MSEHHILLIGLVVVATAALRVGLGRTLVPPLVAFIALGIALRVAGERLGLLGGPAESALELLKWLGLFALLFRVGLESDLGKLLETLPRASVVWVGNVVLSAVPGYLLMRHGFGFGAIPSLVAATALTATSIGVALGAWQRHGQLDTPKGRLLTDVAEMDDLSGVAFMAVLFAVLPTLHAAGGAGGADAADGGALWSRIGVETAVFFAKFAGFAAALLLLRARLERGITRLVERHGSQIELAVMVAGVGITIAGFAAWIGVSAAVGALLAGLVFARDPDAVKIDAGFDGIHHFLVPFFFVGIGLELDPGAAGGAFGLAGGLLAVAILGKVLGAGLPALVSTGAAGALLVGVSMVPRAEITMVIMSRGRELGEWAVPPELYAAFVMVSAVTCLVAPVGLALLFRRFGGPAGEDAGASLRTR